MIGNKERFIKKLEQIRQKWNPNLDFNLKKQILRETYNIYVDEEKKMKDRASHKKEYKQREKLKKEREAMNPFIQKLQDCLQEANFTKFEEIFIKRK